MIYLAMRGFSLIELGMLESSFHITSFLMEIPTGAVADLWSRKASRILGRVFYLSSLFILFLATGFAFQLLGFVLCAIGYNLESGAGEALLYDSLDMKTRESRYMKILGIKEFIIQASSILALLVGGFLATRGYDLVFALSITVVILSLLTAFSFREPIVHQEIKSIEGLHWIKKLKKQTLESLKVVKSRRQIAFYLIFSELIFSFTVSLFFYLQNYWKNIGFSEFHIGAVFAGASLLSGLTSLFAQKIEQKMGGERKLILILPLFLLMSLWGIALSPWKFPFYLVIGFMEGLLLVAISHYINRLIPQEYRATVLSFQSMIFSFFMIALFPLIGWLGETFSLNTAFLIMAITGSLISVFYYSFRIMTKEKNS